MVQHSLGRTSGSFPILPALPLTSVRILGSPPDIPLTPYRPPRHSHGQSSRPLDPWRPRPDERALALGCPREEAPLSPREVGVRPKALGPQGPCTAFPRGLGVPTPLVSRPLPRHPSQGGAVTVLLLGGAVNRAAGPWRCPRALRGMCCLWLQRGCATELNSGAHALSWAIIRP